MNGIKVTELLDSISPGHNNQTNQTSRTILADLVQQLTSNSQFHELLGPPKSNQRKRPGPGGNSNSKASKRPREDPRKRPTPNQGSPNTQPLNLLIVTHGTVNNNHDFFDLGESKVTFYAPFGRPCYSIKRANKITLAHGTSKLPVSRASDLNVTWVKKMLKKSVQTYTKRAPNMTLHFDKPLNGQEHGLFKVGNNVKREPLNEKMSLKQLVSAYGPAHYHVSACRPYTANQNTTGFRRTMEAHNRARRRTMELNFISTSKIKNLTDFLTKTVKNDMRRLGQVGPEKPPPPSPRQQKAMEAFTKYKNGVEKIEDKGAKLDEANLLANLVSEFTRKRRKGVSMSNRHKAQEEQRLANQQEKLLKNLKLDLTDINK